MKNVISSIILILILFVCLFGIIHLFNSSGLSDIFGINSYFDSIKDLISNNSNDDSIKIILEASEFCF